MAKKPQTAMGIEMMLPGVSVMRWLSVEYILPVKDEQPLPARQPVPPPKPLVQASLEIAAKHGCDARRLLKQGHALVQFTGAVPAPQQGSVSGERRGLEQSDKEAECVQLGMLAGVDHKGVEE